MPRLSVENNSRISLRIRAEEKALLLRAVALNHTGLTDFVIRHALRAAKAVIAEADHVLLSERDSLRVLGLLENPPARTQNCWQPLGHCPKTAPGRKAENRRNKGLRLGIH